MFDEVVDSSSTLDNGTGADSPPQPAIPAAPAPVADPPFHQHPRFRELTTQNRELKLMSQQLQTRLQQLETAQRGSVVPNDEQRQLNEAAVALKKIFAADPELKALFESRQYLPQLAHGYTQLSETQQASQRETAKAHVASLAKAEGLPSDPKWTAHLVRLVAGTAMGLENGNERFERGDFGVLTEAFEMVKGDFFAALRTANASTTGLTKLKTKGLPPAPRGGQAGVPAPEGPKPGQERQFTQGLHQKALAMLKESATG